MSEVVSQEQLLGEYEVVLACLREGYFVGQGSQYVFRAMNFITGCLNQIKETMPEDKPKKKAKKK